MNIYLDIETIPGQSPTVRDALSASAALEKADVRAPSNYKDETKIAEYIAAKHAEIDSAADEKWRKTALDGAYGQNVVEYCKGDVERVRAIHRRMTFAEAA